MANCEQGFPKTTAILPQKQMHQNPNLIEHESNNFRPLPPRRSRQRIEQNSDPAVEGQGNPFEKEHIYGMVGVMITMGLTRKSRMRKHWSLSIRDNYPLVRQCMQRDLFELLYCRFLHCSDGSAPPRYLETGEENPDFDSKWHIRRGRVMIHSRAN